LQTVRRELGALVVVGDLNFVEMLPKTRSGKIMRRVLKAVVSGRDPGDVSTIEDEGSVEEAREAWRDMSAQVAETPLKPASRTRSAAHVVASRRSSQVSFFLLGAKGERDDYGEIVTLAYLPPRHRIRLVTAGSLFDGHDAAINIVRRLLQAGGARIIHLGHNRSVAEIVKAAVEEHVNGVCISSYQGGHNEFFRFLVDRLRRRARRTSGVRRRRRRSCPRNRSPQAYECAAFSPDGQKIGFSGIINDVLESLTSTFWIRWTLDTLIPQPCSRSPSTATTCLRLCGEAFEGRLSGRERATNRSSSVLQAPVGQASPLSSTNSSAASVVNSRTRRSASSA
jgi:hypothetical protein